MLIIIFVSTVLKLFDLLFVHYFNLPSILNDLKAATNFFVNKSIFNAIIVFTVAPMFEELMFRLSLIPRKVYFLVTSITLFYFILGGRSYNFYLFYDPVRLIFLISGCFCLFFTFYKISFDRIIKWINKHYTLYFYTWVILFGLIHILNAKNIQWTVIYLYPFFVLPQIILGFAIAYLRNTLNFLYGLAMHIIVNAIAVSFILI
jgi:hypothetical protein